MEIQGEDMPIPINTTYGHAHIIHHEPVPNHNQIPLNAPTHQTQDQFQMPTYKKLVRYKECLKNHAASMGANATDGCGEFLPSGEDGTLECYICSACNCHRNFHRKEIEGENSHCDLFYHNAPHLNRVGRKLILGHHRSDGVGYPGAAAAAAPAVGTLRPAHQVIMSYNMGSVGPDESDEQDGGGGGGGAYRGSSKKRFRTKFTQEQKERMLCFAEKVGWKIQKQEESVVQQFCQELGIKRRVLKVWMHNNKHILAKKNPSLIPPLNQFGKIE